MSDNPRIPPEVLERLRLAVERSLAAPRVQGPVQPRNCGLSRHLRAKPDGPEPRRLYTTTLGEVMQRNGVKFPTIPDLTLADLERHRRKAEPVNPVAAMRLSNEYLMLTDDPGDATARALSDLWRRGHKPAAADWEAIYRGFYRVMQAKRAAATDQAPDTGRDDGNEGQPR